MTTAASPDNPAISEAGKAHGLLGRVAEQGRLRVLVLLAIALLAFLPGLTAMPPLDRDEPRFAQATRQMLETRDFVDIRFQDEARHKKPVGIYWMQAAAVSVGEALGVGDAHRQVWLYRLPSQLGALLSVLLLAWAGAPLVGRRAATLAAAALAVTILLGVEARLAKTDAMILATVLLAQGILIRAYMRGGREPIDTGSAIAFWGAIGLGVLIKGPITPLFIGMTALFAAWFQREWAWLRSLRPWLGAVVVLAIAAPWFIAITLQSNGSFFQESVGQDMIGKIFEGQEKHGAPPGTYLLTVWGTLWPVSPFLLLALPAIWAWRRERGMRFLIAWVLPAWILFELVPTKLPHYILPLVPALMLATARFVLDPPQARAAWLRWPAVFLLLLGAVGLPVAAAVGPYVMEGLPSFRFLPFALAAMALGLVAAWLLLRRRLLPSLLGAGASALVLYAGIYSFAFPEFRMIWPSRSLAEAASAHCPDPQVATAGFREPSLVLQTRTGLVMTDGQGAASFLGGEGCRVAFVVQKQYRRSPGGSGMAWVETNDMSDFRETAQRLGVARRLVTQVKSFNINGGRLLEIGVYANGGPD